MIKMATVHADLRKAIEVAFNDLLAKKELTKYDLMGSSTTGKVAIDIKRELSCPVSRKYLKQYNIWQQVNQW